MRAALSPRTTTKRARSFLAVVCGHGLPFLTTNLERFSYLRREYFFAPIVQSSIFSEFTHSEQLYAYW